MMISLGNVLPDSDASRVMCYINSVTSFTFYFYFTQIMKKNQPLYDDKERMLFSCMWHNLDAS